MNGVTQVFEKTRRSLTEVVLLDYVEPLEHVLEVERLRQVHRPGGDVKLLLIAESHVRVGEDHFLDKGAGFLYEARYYTPWWHHLLLPAFGTVGRTTPKIREQLLLRLRQGGFWLLDVSLLSLSGYNKVDREWPGRPLDEFREQIIWDSWHGHVEKTFDEIMSQRQPPVLFAFNNVSFVLSEQLRKRANLINFNAPRNAGVYFSPDYPFGTCKFKEAAEQAGIAGCLL